MEQSTSWHIAGLGAMGTIIAASLCQGQLPVELILKNKEQIALYNECGLELIADSTYVRCQPNAVSFSSIQTPIQRLICCTKAYDVRALLSSLRPYLTKESMVILVHNGMGVIEEVQTLLPELRIISGIATIGGYLKKPYSVNAFLQGSIVLGETLGHFSQEEISLTLEAFKKSMLITEWSDSIQDLIWNKFSINCSINMLTALFSCKNGELMHHSELLKKLTQEIASVITAYGKECSGSGLFERVSMVIQNTAGNYSSMNQDIKNNRRTEIHYLNAHLLHLAELKGIDTPLTKELLNQFYEQFPNQK